MVSYIRSDLDFILQQIIISERHAAGEDLRDILLNVQVPWGLRTVTGEYNNLITGREQFGAADNLSRGFWIRSTATKGMMARSLA